MRLRLATAAGVAGAVGVAFAGLALTGCESTQEKSAKLERAAKLRGGGPAGAKGLRIAHPSSILKVIETAVVGSHEGAAAVVTVRNTGGRGAFDAPIELTVRDAGGATAYSNTAPGLAHTLVSIPYIPAHGELSWVDDQLPPQAAGGTATATVGDPPGAPPAGPAPALAVSGAKPYEDPVNGLGEEGTVVNRSGVTQKELVIFALARTPHGIAAAGRAVLPQVSAGASTRFQVFWVGSASGAKVDIAAPPTTLR